MSGLRQTPSSSMSWVGAGVCVWEGGGGGVLGGGVRVCQFVDGGGYQSVCMFEFVECACVCMCVCV